jgi:hypothetical protein
MQDGPVYLTNNDLNVLTSTKQTSYGTVGITGDGRRFRYVSFGGTTTIASGQVVQASLPSAQTNSQGLTITATTVSGANQVTGNLATNSVQIVVTGGGTSYTQDQFAEGQLQVLVGGSVSTATYSYKIKGNSASTATNGYTTIYLVPEEPLRNTTAIVAGTDTANLLLSPFQGVNTTTTTTNIPVGLTVGPVVNTSSVTNYGWVQVAGIGAAITDGSAILSSSSLIPSATAGAVALASGSRPIIGNAMVANGSTTAGIPVVLTIDN